MAHAAVPRREVLRLALGAPLLLAAIPRAAGAEDGPYGALGSPDAHGLMLPPGFRARELAVAGSPVGRSGYRWHVFPDGGATFSHADGGWVYVSNSEVPNGAGGVGALRFSADGELVDAYPICTGTGLNCAGGPTPWGTWLSGEEFPEGRVWECDPFGERDAVAREALGVFQHEAVAVDPVRHALYLTEDTPDGRLYRFVPTTWPDLGAGTLEVAREADDGGVTWVARRDDGTAYPGGEGIAYHDGVVVFTTKYDHSVREYDVQRSAMRVRYGPSQPGLTGPDNVVFSSSGDLYVCEDDDTAQDLVLVGARGAAVPVLRLDDSHAGSELAGAAFDPSGTRLYVSSQRAAGTGITYEIVGPFRRLEVAASTTVPSTAPTSAGDPRRSAARRANDGGDSVLPVAGAAGGAVAVLGGLAWWRHRRGTREA